MESYSKVNRYARKFDINYRDLVHDTYVRWFDETGRDLFNEQFGTIAAAIKITWRENYAKDRFIWRGERHQRIFKSLTSNFENQDGEIVSQDYTPVSSIDPEQEMIFNEYLSQIQVGLTRRQTTALYYILQGYRNNEVVEITGLGDNTVTRAVSNVRNKVEALVGKRRKMNYTNPFRGSKTIVRKKVSEGAWDKRKDIADFELEEYNEEQRLYVHKESSEGWLVKITNPKSSEFYIKRLVDSKK